MPDSFGARLRRRREERQIALVAIAEQTKISASLLQGLERDDVSQWPSGIFRRAFIRAYARAVGLDPDATVREFLEIHPEPDDTAVTALAKATAADSPRTNGAPSTRLGFLVGSAIGSISRLRRGPLEDAAAPDQDVAPSPIPAAPPAANLDLQAVAQLCTKLGRVENAREMQPLLREAVGLLRAKGLIVWVWDKAAAVLRPALAYGYPQRVLRLLAAVKPDANNATAAAYRSAESCAIEGDELTGGALAIPLLTPAGCTGVLAIELQHGHEQRSARAVATILAALLAQLVGSPKAADTPPPAARGTDHEGLRLT